MQPKHSIALDMNLEIQIARFSAVEAGLTLARHAHPCGFLNACRNTDLDRAFLQLDTGSPAHHAGPTTDDAGAAASFARYPLRKFYATGDAAEHFGDREFDFDLQVFSLYGELLSATGASPASSEKCVEYVVEVAATER